MIEAKWFMQWCAVMQKKPVFPPIRADAVKANAKRSKKSSRSSKLPRDETHPFRHLVCGLVDISEDQLSGVAGMKRTVPRLNNSVLLVNDANVDGCVRLGPAHSVLPYSAANIANGTETSSAVQYVLVPCDLGRRLYESYDDNWASLSSSFFIRYVCIISFLCWFL